MSKSSEFCAGQAILFVNVQKELHVCQQRQRGDVTALRTLEEVGERRGVSTNQDAQLGKALAERGEETSAGLA